MGKKAMETEVKSRELDKKEKTEKMETAENDAFGGFAGASS
jgi:hypothetical protein